MIYWISFFVLFVCVPIGVWFWMRQRTRNLHQHLQATMAACACEKAKERAQTTRDSVEVVMQKIDSRAPDEKPVTIVPDVPETAEHPPLPDKRNGATTIAAPVFFLLLAGVFLLGGWTRERASGAREMAVSPMTNEEAAYRHGRALTGTDSRGFERRATHGQFDARLAELRTRPTLAAVVYFSGQPVRDEHRAKVVKALRDCSDDSSKSVSFAARAELKRWE